ncbi:MAG TPA: TylF/MycF/NovP-related O-methyltransferase [Longimicrobium sp.]|nr:TylF/MycF/NovP-related O-methyltransferase [Longimicrobium sp.]
MPSDFSLKGRLLRAWLARRGATVVQALGPQARADLALVQQTRAMAPLLVQDAAALQIVACVRAVRALGGTMAEAGVFAGGTARLICAEKGDAPLRLFDVFETLQAPEPPAGSGRAAELRGHFGAVHAPRAGVERLLAPYPAVHLHAGIFPDTARGLEGERFSFVHIDLDLEPSTRDALEFFHPRLLPGGIIIGDDYHDPGVRRAFEAYFQGRPDPLIALPWGQVVVVKPDGA